MQKLRILLPAFAHEVAAARRDAARLRLRNAKLHRRIVELESASTSLTSYSAQRREFAPPPKASTTDAVNRKALTEMPVKPAKILYTTEATVEGGREGHGRTSDGRLEVPLSGPETMGGAGGAGTNPEQLFAVGYAACFQSALLGVARGRQLDASDSRIVSTVGIGPTGSGGFTLQVSLDLHAPRLSQEDARDLMARAHERCPYSNATRGNIDVMLMVDGHLI